MQRDAQVVDRTLTLCEDWARSLPQPVFPDTLGTVLSAGVRLPERPDADKAPVLNMEEYERMRQEQNARLAAVRRKTDGAGSGRQRSGPYSQLQGSPDVRSGSCSFFRDGGLFSLFVAPP